MTGHSSSETECAVCGTSEQPEKGWIYKSSGVAPDEIVDGELRFKAKDGAEAYCSTDCSQQANTDRAHIEPHELGLLIVAVGLILMMGLLLGVLTL